MYLSLEGGMYELRGHSEVALILDSRRSQKACSHVVGLLQFCVRKPSIVLQSHGSRLLLSDLSVYTCHPLVTDTSSNEHILQLLLFLAQWGVLLLLLLSQHDVFCYSSSYILLSLSDNFWQCVLSYHNGNINKRRIFFACNFPFDTFETS